jgi:hypothetical protein
MGSWPKIVVKDYKDKRTQPIEDEEDNKRIKSPRRQKKKRKRSKE